MNAGSLLKLWNKLEKLPGGKKAASFIIGKLVPYTGSISAEIESISLGSSKVMLRDCRKVRNHLNSIHAVALVNLGEFTTGLACLSALPSNGRSILKGLSIEYLKKARGTLVAEAHTPLIEGSFDKRDCIIVTEIKNTAGETVARLQATWQVGNTSK
jgi:acyl-coenzyme A thioesterase PaaI-like protein